MAYRNVVVLLLAVLCVSSASAAAFGTYLKLFNAQSLWNSKPINPVFAPNISIPIDDRHPTWAPTVSSGAYSTGIYLAKNSDPAVTVYGFGTKGLNNVDAYKPIPSITLPHWPAEAVGATGDDGHCDIVDEETGIVHSFWQLRYNNVTNNWNATQYAWSPLKGYGFGTPDHFYQGARAVGVPTSAGVIRKQEASDGEPMFYHALACSLTYSGLSNNPTYIYPATAADQKAEETNYGKVPEGALLMLPPDFNTSRISSPNLRKVAETLKVYGMYVVDRNDGTPYAIYVENGASFRLSNKTDWDNDVANQLHLIRANLKMLSSCDYYEDGNGEKLVQPYPNQNLLSMRGTDWNKIYNTGEAAVRFDTWTQSLVFEQTNNKSTTYQSWAGQGINAVKWAKLQKGVNYTVTVEATANCTLKFVFEYNQTSTGGFFSKTLGNGQTSSFVWPTGAASPYMVLYATKPPGGPGRVRGFIYATENIVPVSSTTSNAGTTGTNNAATTTNAATTEGGPANEDSAGTLIHPSLILAFVLAYLFI